MLFSTVGRRIDPTLGSDLSRTLLNCISSKQKHWDREKYASEIKSVHVLFPRFHKPTGLVGGWLARDGDGSRGGVYGWSLLADQGTMG